MRLEPPAFTVSQVNGMPANDNRAMSARQTARPFQGNSMKPNKTPKTTGSDLSGPNRLIAVGNAGAAFCLSAPPEGAAVDGSPVVVSYRGFKACGLDPVDVGTLHGRGEPCGLPEWDSAAFVAHRGQPTRFLPLSVALAQGIVKAHRVCLVRDGAKSEAVVFAPAAWSPAQRQPKFLATEAMKAGRVESSLVQPDKRNSTYTGKVLPLAFLGVAKPVKPAPAPASKPVKPVKPTGKRK